MANRECNGLFFVARGTRYWACFWDGKVVSAPPEVKICPNCRRPISACDVGELKPVSVEYVDIPRQSGRFWLPPSDEHEKSCDAKPSFVTDEDQKWEKCGEGAYRIKVQGGWVFGDTDDPSGICFIPDPDHLWQIRKAEETQDGSCCHKGQ